MRIIVDADGCPVKEIIQDIAKKTGLDVLFVMNIAHEYSPEYGSVKFVDKSRERADIVIVNVIESGDLVVTQDYGLAAMVLAKKGHCMNQNGKVFNDMNIELLLHRRHLNREIRNRHKKYTKTNKRTKDDDLNFKESLIRMIKEVL